MCLQACWKKVRPKYKQVVLDLYPEGGQADAERVPKAGPARPSASSVSALTYYANRFPGRLPAIGRYLLKRIRADHAAGRLGNVEVGVVAFGALVDSCHSDLTALTVYDDSVTAAVRLLLADGQDDCRLLELATRTLGKLLCYQDNASDFHKFEPFFDRLIALATNERGGDAQERLRAAGLTAITQLVQFNDPHRTAAHFDAVLPAVLANLPEDRDALERVRRRAAARHAAEIRGAGRGAERRAAARATQPAEKPAKRKKRRWRGRKSGKKKQKKGKKAKRSEEEEGEEKKKKKEKGQGGKKQEEEVEEDDEAKEELEAGGDVHVTGGGDEAGATEMVDMAPAGKESGGNEGDDDDGDGDGNGDGDDGSDDAEVVAYQCLVAIASSSSTATNVQQVLSPVLAYFGAGGWRARDLAAECIRLVANHSQLQYGDILCFTLLQHLGSADEVAAVEVPQEVADCESEASARLLEVAARVVETMQLEVGSWGGVLQFLLVHVERAGARLGPAAFARFAAAATRCLGAYSLRVPSPGDSITMVGLVLRQLEQLDGGRGAGGAAPAVRLAFARGALRVAEVHRPLGPHYCAPDGVVSRAVRLCARSDDAELRATVYSVLLQVALRPAAGEENGSAERAERDEEKQEPAAAPGVALCTAASGVGAGRLAAFAAGWRDDGSGQGQGGAPPAAPVYRAEQRAWLQGSVYSELTGDRSTPETVAASFSLLAALLAASLADELRAQAPMLRATLALAERRRASAANVPRVRETSRCCAAAAAAFLTCVSRASARLGAPETCAAAAELESVVDASGAPAAVAGLPLLGAGALREAGEGLDAVLVDGARADRLLVRLAELNAASPAERDAARGEVLAEFVAPDLAALESGDLPGSSEPSVSYDPAQDDSRAWAVNNSSITSAASALGGGESDGGGGGGGGGGDLAEEDATSDDDGGGGGGGSVAGGGDGDADGDAPGGDANSFEAVTAHMDAVASRRGRQVSTFMAGLFHEGSDDSDDEFERRRRRPSLGGAQHSTDDEEDDYGRPSLRPGFPALQTLDTR